MSSFNLQSTVTFEARAREIGFSEDELNRLRAYGWNTFGRLAFSANYTPGSQDESGLRLLACQIFGTSPDAIPAARMPLVRMIYFEAYTFAAADLRSRVERRSDDAPRLLAPLEREARREEQRKRLVGLTLTGELEISDALMDLVVQISETNRLRYIGWELCTKRDLEVLGVKLDPVWKPDANCVIKEVQSAQSSRPSTSPQIQATTFYLSTRCNVDPWLLTRRGLCHFKRWKAGITSYWGPTWSSHLRVIGS